ncbi:GAP family protein [Nocardioides sp. CCNWLW239]|uniref:GAP family protein n=1 Tax=Nocardioides sp. CCNWLW239 TaxID=3128902 RepID=UPI0030183E97
MWELVGQLLPEMVGLAVTPAAIVACLLLLGSSHPFRNVVALAAPFLVVYGMLSAIALVAGRAAETGTEDPSTIRGWISLVVGALFVIAAGISWFRPVRRSVDPRSPGAMAPGAEAEPGWVSRLRDPSLRLVLGAGLLLALVNPNVAILLSGLGIVITADTTVGTQVVGVALLLAASMVDFVVPMIVFLLAGERGREWLRTATRWLLAHNRIIGIVVLIVFGVLFVGRGLAQILS